MSRATAAVEDARTAAAREVYAWLAAADPWPPAGPAEAVVGFGHFDLRIARHCVGIWRAGLAPLVIFTGGVGAGSADLTLPEAEAFAAEARRLAPEIEPALVREAHSTNTGENLRLTAAVLEARGGPRPGEELRRAILVASPYRQRRVRRTAEVVWPGVDLIDAPVPSTFEEEVALFASKGQDFIAHLPGEVRRLLDYPARGWCRPGPIPPAVQAAAARLASP